MSEELEIVGDEALEARLTAWVVGEASDFEQEELQRLCLERPELAVFKRRIESIHLLIEHQNVTDHEKWKLSESRRKQVLAKTGGDQVIEWKRSVRKLNRQRYLVASLLLFCLLGPVLFMVFGTSGSKSAKQVLREAALEGELLVHAKPKPSSEPSNAYEIQADQTTNPGSPSSSNGQIITGKTTSPSPEFDDSDDFGSGWGSRRDLAGVDQAWELPRRGTASREVALNETGPKTRSQSETKEAADAFGAAEDIPTSGLRSSQVMFKGAMLTLEEESKTLEASKDADFDSARQPGSSEAATSLLSALEPSQGDSEADSIAEEENLFTVQPSQPLAEGLDVASDRSVIDLQIEDGRYEYLPTSENNGKNQERGLAEKREEMGDDRGVALFKAKQRSRHAPTTPIVLPEEKDAAQEDSSTFSLNVSDVSFQLAKGALEKGTWPGEVRVEEFINAMNYGERQLPQGEKVGLAMEQAAHPTIPQRNLLRLSLQTAASGRQEGVPLRLTVVLDKSGSMERLDRAEAVEEAFRVLVQQLVEGDRVTLLGFSRTPRLLADDYGAQDGESLLEILKTTPSEGGTNVEEALSLAHAKAREHYAPEAINRVILLTDGIANLGNEVPEQLMTMVEAMRSEGIAFDVCGVGAEGVNDEILEALSRKGDGRYYLLSSQQESGADFAKQVAGALRPAAKNVKIQVEWNPDRVGMWQLYGFKKHELKEEDFRNDEVDAAELAAEEEGVALYHVQVKPDGEGPLGMVRARFLDVASGEMVEREWEIPFVGEASPLVLADSSVRMAGVAGLSAEKLNRSAVGERVEWSFLLEQVRQLKSLSPPDQRLVDLEEMIESAKALD